ncbi:MAG: hypothetical protein KDD64_01910 [Bdellovibrionales bacterium]|nr:hypothetical protein [Bdellovibrionales bacterium]
MTSILVAKEQYGFFQKLLSNGESSVSPESSFSLFPFEDGEQLVDLLTDGQSSGIVLVRLNGARSRQLIRVLEVLWQKRLDIPYYAILSATKSRLAEALQFVNEGFHDVVVNPIERDLLIRKVLVASQLVADKRTLVESSEVLERYAKHIDAVAAERARQLFHAERLSTLGTMSAGLAHELKTPIGYISTSFETTKIYWEKVDQSIRQALTEGQQLDEKVLTKALDSVPRALSRIDVGLEKITRLTSNLKKFAHASKEERTECSLNSCIQMALEMCESAVNGKIEVVTDLAEDLPLIRIDSQQVEQVFINLVVNAAHALEGQEYPRITLRTQTDGDRVEAFVEDNGPGIPQEHLQSIFKPFYTTKEIGKGTGLGLAISQSLVRDNGGEISVTNKDTGGALFTLRFSLPRPDAAVKAN